MKLDQKAANAIIIALVRRAGGSITITQADTREGDEVHIEQDANGAITLKLVEGNPC